MIEAYKGSKFSSKSKYDVIYCFHEFIINFLGLHIPFCNFNLWFNFYFDKKFLFGVKSNFVCNGFHEKFESSRISFGILEIFSDWLE